MKKIFAYSFSPTPLQRRGTLFLALITLAFASCQKEIDIDLNSAEPKIVIEANLFNTSCFVKLSKTVNFDEANEFPAVKGAIIRLTDDVGNKWTLLEGTRGNYSETVVSAAGRTYTLEVTVEGTTYTSTCKMPYPTDIDSLAFTAAPFDGDIQMLNVYFTDRVGEKNYYRALQYVNGEFIPDDVPIAEDRLMDGKNIQIPIFRAPEAGILPAGDTVEVRLQSIDFPVYEYFRTLEMVKQGGGLSTPTNPISNISNGALGYFNACSYTSKQIIVP